MCDTLWKGKQKQNMNHYLCSKYRNTFQRKST